MLINKTFNFKECIEKLLDENSNNNSVAMKMSQNFERDDFYSGFSFSFTLINVKFFIQHHINLILR